MKKAIHNLEKHHGPVVGTHDGHDIINCKQCGFKHTNPIPSEQELKEFYAQFYTDEKPNYFKDAEEDYDWWMTGYKNYYRLLEKRTKGRKLLDIGSGPGYFLKCGQELGWETIGFEPSKHAHEYSTGMGLKVINSNFDIEAAQKAGPFDVVSLNLVLEHLPNPKELLKQFSQILKKGGLLFILSPNDFNPLQEALMNSGGFNPWWLYPLEHINYFNFSSIKKVLKDLNYKIVDTLTTYPMEFFLLNGENYIGNREVGRACHKRRKNFEMNLYKQDPELLNQLYRSLAKNNIGREFVVIAENA